MSTERIRTIAFLVLAFALSCLSLEQALAQSPQPEQRQATPQTTITDSAGRVHKVMPMRKTSPEQRKAAAKRLKANPTAPDTQQNQDAAVVKPNTDTEQEVTK